MLGRLTDRAYAENLSLRIAGLRVLEARAQLGIAVGGLYPQDQQARGYWQYNRTSENAPQAAISSRLDYQQAEIGFSAGWELDFWGKFRRAVESAQADWQASVADYDQALVSLTADVAGSYILIRTLEKRIDIARRNVAAQREALEIAEAGVRYGTTTQLDWSRPNRIEQCPGFDPGVGDPGAPGPECPQPPAGAPARPFIRNTALASKNAILVVEFARDLQRESLSAIEATGRRFRPIVMTFLAFILGVAPLVFTGGAGAASQQAIGTAVFGGMIASTLLAIPFVPVFYVVTRRFDRSQKNPASSSPKKGPSPDRERKKQEPGDD